MRNFTFIKSSSKSLLLVLYFSLMSLNIFAESMPAVAPNATNITALLSAPDLNSGPFFNATEDNRVKFTFTNNGNQNLYFGFDMIYIRKILFSYKYIPIIVTKLPLNETFKIIH